MKKFFVVLAMLIVSIVNFVWASEEEIQNRPETGPFFWIVITMCALILAKKLRDLIIEFRK